MFHTVEHSPLLSTGSGFQRPKAQPWCFQTPKLVLCPAQALSWCKSAQPTQSVVPQGPCPSWGKLPLSSHCLGPGWEKVPSNVPFITLNYLTQQPVFDAGPGTRGIISSLWNNARAYPSPDWAGKPCARESQQCCKSSKKDKTERLLLLIFFTTTKHRGGPWLHEKSRLLFPCRS